MQEMHGKPGGDAATDHVGRGEGGAKIKVNGKSYTVSTGRPDGRDVLTAAGMLPADEHVLIHVLRPGSRSVGIDEHVKLHGHDDEFYAFRNDRTFSFTVEAVGYEWGADSIGEPLLRDLAGISEDKVLMLVRKGQPDSEIEEGSDIQLGPSGVEHLRVSKGLVTVCFNNEEVQIPRGTYTTEQLSAVLGVEPGYLLNVMGPDGQLETLKPGHRIKVRKGLKFISQAPCGGSS